MTDKTNHKCRYGDFLKEGFQVVLINLLIGFFLTIIELGQGLIINLVFAQFIGLSIFAFVKSALFFADKTPALHKYLLLAFAILAGVLVGLIIGSLVTDYNGIKFILENQAFTVKIFIFSLAAGLIVSNFFISRRNLNLAHNRAQNEKILRLAQEKEALQAELKMLQAQIEPHFLFNTLSNIHSLIQTDITRAEKMLLNLTDFLRSTLTRSRKAKITLSEEMEIVKTYLEIQQIRMGKRLQFQLTIDPQVSDISIPPMLIQPLVENSIQHGLESNVEGGKIVINARKQNNKVIICVIDNGRGFTDYHSNGIGLSNIRTRLQLLFGQSGKLLLEENPQHGVIATLEIPYETTD